MKDIILIDDNSKDQRRSYGASFVDDELYDDILEHIELLNNNSDISFLKDAKCVMIHDSLEDFINGRFDKKSHEAKDNIIDLLDDNDIPYICFSDGHQSTGEYDLSGNLVKIKKSEFYNRLRYFLDLYRQEGILQFHIIAYGKNFNKEFISKAVRGLFKKIELKAPHELISSEDVLPKERDEEPFLENIIRLAKPILGIDYPSMMDFLDDNEITVTEFKARINNILNSIIQNGENTYTWK